MSFDYSKIIINKPIANKTSNFDILNNKGVKDGIQKSSGLLSSIPNSFLYKITDSINFIQSNGNLSYIKNKLYKINSIVNVIYVTDQGTLNNSLLKCINTDYDDYCSIIPNNFYNEDDNGNIIFNNNKWNTNYWEEIIKNGESNYIKELSNFEFNYSAYPNSRSELQIKHLELFDFNNEETLSNLSFSLYIDRYYPLSLNCSISGVKGNIKLKINALTYKDSNTNNLSSIWDNNSIFKDIALQGMFFSVNEETNKVYLHWLGSEAIINGKTTFEIELETDKGYAPLSLNEASISDFIYNESYIIVPFIRGASNKFSNKSMELFEYIDVLPANKVFENGLYRVNKETTLDNWLYPIVNNKINLKSGKWSDKKIYNCLERYKISTNNNTRYIEPKFPEIEGETSNGLVYDDTGLTGAFSLGVSKGTAADVRTEPPGTYQYYYATGQGYSADNSKAGNNFYGKQVAYPRVQSQYQFDYNDDIDWELCGWAGVDGNYLATSDPDDPDRLTTRSGVVYTYLKIW